MRSSRSIVRSARSSLRTLPSLLSLCAVFAGCTAASGTGTVEANFPSGECPLGRTPGALEDYRYDAGWLATERFGGVLVIYILKHPVLLEETDGLLIRVEFDRLLESGALVRDPARGQISRADPGAPLIIGMGGEDELAAATLNLIRTCPTLPTQVVSQGVLTLDQLTLSIDPADTGERERIAGTVTATLTNSSVRGTVGNVVSVFDFAPPRRPLTEFK